MSSGRNNLVVHEMEPYDLGAVSVLEMTAHRVAQSLTKLREIVGFGEDRGLEVAGGVAPFGRFFDDEENFRS